MNKFTSLFPVLLLLMPSVVVQAKSVKLHIKPVYDEAGYFQHGLALVRLNGKYGYIDKSGKMVIPARFTAAGNFGRNRSNASVSVGDAYGRMKWGIIDRNGKWIVKDRFEKLSEITGGMAIFKKGEFDGVVDQDGKIILEAKYKRIKLYKSGLIAAARTHHSSWILHNRNGKRVNPDAFHEIKRVTDSDYLVAVKRVGMKKNDVWGFVGGNGKWVVMPTYKYVNNIHTTASMHQLDHFFEYAKNGEPISVRVQNLWGYISGKGKLVINYAFYRAGVFVNGLSQVNDGPVINRKGQVVRYPKWLPGNWSAEDRKYNLEQMMMARIRPAKTRLIPRYCQNAKGQKIRAPERTVPRREYFGYFREGFSIAHTVAGSGRNYKSSYPGLMGVIGTDCQWAYPPVFDYVSVFRDGMAVVKKNGKYGYLKIVR